MHADRLTIVRSSVLVLIACWFGPTSEGAAADLVAAWGNNSFGQTRLSPSVADVKAISAGDFHNLALKADGTVLAWGGGSYSYRGATNVPLGLQGVVAIAAGGYHSLALKADGSVVGWGYDNFGQATPASGLSNVVAIAAGRNHSLALKANGRVLAWGSSGMANVPPDLSNVVAIAAGDDHNLALRTDGSVVAWGRNDSGQLNVPAGLSNVRAIAAGTYYSLALIADGSVVAWGSNSYGQTNPPPGLSNVKAIAAGAHHCMALRADGSVVAWGNNSYGNTKLPPGLANATAIAAGNSHSLALVPEGPLRIIGLNDQAVPYTSNATFSVRVSGWEPIGYQWLATYSPLYAPTPIAGATNAMLTITNAQFSDIRTYFVEVSNAFGSVVSTGATLTVISPPFLFSQSLSQTQMVGANVTLLISASGTPPLSYQWSHNGTAIPGATGSNLSLTNVQNMTSGSYVVLVTNQYGSITSDEILLVVVEGSPFIWSHPSNQVASIGGSTTMAVSATGSAPLSYQWQFNGADIPGATNPSLTLSQLRYEQSGHYNVRVTNPGGERFSAKALLSVVQVVLWPHSYSAFGYPTNLPNGLTNAVAISAGSYHFVALRTDGTVAVWLGQDYYANPSVTNIPSGLNGVVSVAAGPYYNLAIRSNGTVVAWGQLTNVPAGLTNVIAVAAGYYHALALRGNGTVAAWGDNYSGQTNVPPGLSNVTAVAAGEHHSLALKADGTIRAWGSSQTNVPAGVSNVIAIAAERDQNMALRADGSVVVWGGSYPPDAPAGLSNVVSIALGRQFLALRSDGTILGWGYKPAVPAGLSNVVAIAESQRSGAFSIAAVGSGAPAFTIQPATQVTAKGATVWLHARAAGVQPLSYQWQFNGADMPGATDADLVLTGTQVTNLGDYQVAVINALGRTMSGVAALTIPYLGTLAESLNATNLVWTNAAPTNAAWFGQVRDTHDGDAAAQSGSISHNRQSILQTSVFGPGTLTFWWKVSSEPAYDFLKFYLDNTNTFPESITGETEWRQKVVSIPSGLHKLIWVYAKDVSVSSGRDAGWVDEVVFTPAPPVITSQPASQAHAMGGTAWFEISATGTPPLTFQWTQNGVDLPGATGSVYVRTNLTRRDSGVYFVRVSNAGGSSWSSNALLTVRAPQRLGAPTVLPGRGVVLFSIDADGAAMVPSDLAAMEALVSTNLIDWVTLPETLTVTNGFLQLHDSGGGSGGARFYRIIEH